MSFRVIVVPGRGTKLFSVTAAMLKGLATLFHPTNPRVDKDGVVVPMQQLGVDDTAGKVMYSIKVKLGDGAGGQMVLGDNPDGLALKAESANLWHRRMGDINGKSLDVLRKEPGNGVDYTGTVKAGDSCSLRIITQQIHPNQATEAFCAPSSTRPLTPWAPSNLKHWAISGTPPSSLTRRPSGRMSTS